MTDISEATLPQLNEVLHWLKQEQDESFEGFYCNKEIIISSFYDSEMQCLSKSDHVIGFSIFSHKTSGASIDILEIHPHHRGSGHGTMLAQHLIGYLFQSGADYVSVKCSPRSSERFWRGLGFIDRPDRHQQLPPLELLLRR
jgi:ribosomal protein S18 acetylase RimI-like enzyme